ncbi:MAG TPA: hypothetical protein DIU37_03295 [Opitutae bacterium]|nr:hypothetical protein [Opitutae bacterium]|tara:strand:- start:586 stop:891 length:306 start_codon:yes stop_codon:yes gene_type:complete
MFFEVLEDRQLLAGLSDDPGKGEQADEDLSALSLDQEVGIDWEALGEQVCTFALWGLIIGTPIFVGVGVYFGEVVPDVWDVNNGDPCNGFSYNGMPPNQLL